ncbi:MULTISPECIES: SSI family serine proteinase inhibitor [Streptomyces]|uniref:SSI family serine proteinase inhibitor n=1 Tax=Streptomyces TaxID=1883 RepID=UPI003CF34322
MTTSMRAVRALVLAGAALLTAGAVPAEAVPRTSHAGDWLHLTVTHGDVATGGTRGALLLCDPPGGHPHAVRACEELDAADGDISRIPPAPDAVCSLIYAPVTASAQGVWDGRRIDYTHTFSNSCVMEAETGAVFALTD